ncbi:MAG: ACT domain-containing protein [Ruminococcus sp.]|nr:ACT domain-containing protein [Ruminococcus sp.]
MKQISVFVENQPGSLMRVTSALNEARINIRAIASFDTPEFGILRLVVEQPEKAKEFLTEKGFVVRVQEVVGAELKDEKGNLNEMLKVLADQGISVGYIYSFVIRENKAPVMVFHSDDNVKAEAALKEAGILLIKDDEL